ncbi:MAG: OmpA family protein [Tepidiformaceae bacterium]
MSKKAPEPEKPENHERWIVSYADMLTLLFALFVVLYATSDANPNKLKQVKNSIDRAFSVGIKDGDNGASVIFDSGGGLTDGINAVKSRNLIDISKSIDDFTTNNKLNGRIQVRSDAQSITISLQDNMLFDSGSADLKPGSQDVLAEVASALKGLPNEMRIEGHTDNVPVNSADFTNNWDLSAARASRVLRFVSDSGGLDQSKLVLAGYADTRPIADNNTPEGRAANRRADIVIIYPTQADLQRSLGGTGTVGP